MTKGSDRWMAPQKPYTGDGKKTREYSLPAKVRVVFRDKDGKVVKKNEGK